MSRTIPFLSDHGDGGQFMDWPRILAYITGTVDQELLLRNEYLVAENRILRDQVNGRLLLSVSQKKTLAEIGYRLGRKGLEDVANAAKPDTILGWYRAATGYLLPRRGSARQRGQRSFVPTWRYWRAPTSSAWKSSRCAGW